MIKAYEEYIWFETNIGLLSREEDYRILNIYTKKKLIGQLATDIVKMKVLLPLK